MIYLVEDDDSVREVVCYALRSSGFVVTGFENADSFWQKIKNEIPHLVILDIMLPDEDGLSILAKLKNTDKTTHLPVIMLTAMGAEYDRIKGLDAGADDYIAKPFSVLELLARVRALLRRSGHGGTKEKKQETGSENEIIQLGELTLDFAKRVVKVQGKEVTLTLKEFELLLLLLRHKDIVLTREQLVTKVWGYEYDGASNRTVDVHIKTLRQKLIVCGDMIKTIRGVGYKITCAEESL